MCIFSGEVDRVSKTKIFARLVEPGLQALVYEMTVSMRQDAAMILPLPTPHDAGEDALRFISFDEYTGFFDDMRNGFPESVAQPHPLAQGVATNGMLAVHSVGAFHASHVPSITDFDRLDEKFRLPGHIWADLFEYVSYSFAVFQLKPGAELRFHPMAFVFPTAEPESIFFPTVHVHEGKFEKKAWFDHQLFWQADNPPKDAQPSDGLAGSFLRCNEGGRDFTSGLVDAGRPVYRYRIDGSRDNEDVRVSPSGEGELS